MFFGAGNLIFPVLMGQMAGASVWRAILGFLVTGVTLPMLGVAALGKTRSNSIYELGQKVSKPYSMVFALMLYLTIGPFFAIPRCATVSFEVGIAPLFEDGSKLALLIFSFIFFAVGCLFSLRPTNIMKYIGKWLNPIFLAALAILVIVALIKPMGTIAGVAPSGDYITDPFGTGLYEGYNTMDALAGLAFGIVVVDVIKRLGIEDPDDIAKETIHAGIYSCAFMGIIYLATAVVGAQSRGVLEVCANGGEALYEIGHYYFGTFGSVILAIIVTFACLKTTVGLVTSCAATFADMWPKFISRRDWTIAISVISFLVANLGLNRITSISIPALMFSYPLAIVIILLALFEKRFGGSRTVYRSTIFFVLPVSILDFIISGPFNEDLIELALKIRDILPLGDAGLGWVCLAVIGFIVGLIKKRGKKNEWDKTAEE